MSSATWSVGAATGRFDRRGRLALGGVFILETLLYFIARLVFIGFGLRLATES